MASTRKKLFRKTSIAHNKATKSPQNTKNANPWLCVRNKHPQKHFVPEGYVNDWKMSRKNMR